MHVEMRLWVDDERPPPDGWDWAKTSAEALAVIKATMPDMISLDHDLGGEDTTRCIVTWMCENDLWPRKIRVHTANPVGRDWLEGTIRRYAPSDTLRSW